MAVSFLARLAQASPAPVFPIAGEGGRRRIHDVRLSDRVTLASSPRHASVLLVAGRLPRALWPAAALVHDQMPPPRGVVLWGAGGSPFPEPVRVAGEDDPVAALVAMDRALLAGERDGSANLLPSENPVKWRGVGPHGQGGEGMMGGTPYGRPMAMTGPDVRDGLELDRVSLTMGPFLPWLPVGLELHVELQGDVVQELAIRAAPLDRPEIPEVFLRAERERVSLGELERARARHHLEATANLLLLHGLDALAEKALRLRARGAAEVRSFERRLVRTGALRLATRGVGRLPEQRIEDARTNDPPYQELGFRPGPSAAEDAEARWRSWLREAARSLELAERAGGRPREPGAPLQGVRLCDAPSAERIAEVAAGRSWGEVVTMLVSLDLDATDFEPSAELGENQVGRSGDEQDED